MKVIDLLNKIANGEKIPKKIKLKDSEPVYEYKNMQFSYWYKDIKTGKGGEAILDLIYNINAEIEIIEEDKGISKIIKLNNVSNASDLIALGQMQWENNKIIENKINEIIEVINNEYNK